MRSLLVLGLLPLAAVLAAFSPPLPSPEGVQQAPPKSWIPEPKEKAPPFEYHAGEREDKNAPAGQQPPTAQTHAPPGVACDAAHSGLQKTTRAFVDSYQAAKSAVEGRRWDEAITLAEAAAGQAKTAQEWSAVEGIRIMALSATHADAELVATLEAVLTIGCLSLPQRANYQEMLDTTRQRLVAPKQ